MVIFIFIFFYLLSLLANKIYAQTEFCDNRLLIPQNRYNSSNTVNMLRMRGIKFSGLVDSKRNVAIFGLYSVPLTDTALFTLPSYPLLPNETMDTDRIHIISPYSLNVVDISLEYSNAPFMYVAGASTGSSNSYIFKVSITGNNYSDITFTVIDTIDLGIILFFI